MTTFMSGLTWTRVAWWRMLCVVHDGDPGGDIGAGDVGHHPPHGQGPGLHQQQAVQGPPVCRHGPAHLNGQDLITEHHVSQMDKNVNLVRFVASDCW